jgi:hypothetical protein
VNRNGFIGLEGDFDHKLNGVLHTVRIEIQSIQDMGQITIMEILNSVHQFRSELMYVINTMLQTFEELKMEVNDRRANKAI